MAFSKIARLEYTCAVATPVIHEDDAAPRDFICLDDSTDQADDPSTGLRQYLFLIKAGNHFRKGWAATMLLCWMVFVMLTKRYIRNRAGSHCLSRAFSGTTDLLGLQNACRLASIQQRSHSDHVVSFAMWYTRCR
jgi:hypothetical protein